MTTKLEQERDRLAKEFADLSVSINGKNDTEDQKQLYWYGVRHGYSNGFDAASEIHKKRIEKLREALNKLTEEMQVFLNVSLKHHFPDAREAQANAIAALQEDGE